MRLLQKRNGDKYRLKLRSNQPTFFIRTATIYITLQANIIPTFYKQDIKKGCRSEVKLV